MKVESVISPWSIFWSLLPPMMLLMMVACQKSPKQIDIRKAPQNPPEEIAPEVEPDQPAGKATIVTELPQTAFEEAGLNVAALSYKFSYLSHAMDGAIQFVDGRARIELKELTVGQSGLLTFEVYESGTLKLKGEAVDLALTEGQNNLDLTLKSVPGESPTEQADLTINLQIETEPEPEPEPDALIPEGWDARSFVGSSVWNIAEAQ